MICKQQIRQQKWAVAPKAILNEGKCSRKYCHQKTELRFFENLGYMCEEHYINGARCKENDCGDPAIEKGLCRKHFLGKMAPIKIALSGDSMIAEFQFYE